MTTTTYHALRGTKYSGGGWTPTGATQTTSDGAEWLEIKADGATWFARACDLFATETQARAEARSRRAPRQVRTPQPLYGDFAQLAALNGIRTDGTGRRSAR
jgi:hypothetical protein